MTDTKLHANNISTDLDGGITNVQTTIDVSDATGMPSPTGSQYFAVTVTDGTSIEIMHCTSRSGATLTVTRGQEGTSGTAFVDGDTVEIRVTADDVDRKINADDDWTINGDWTWQTGTNTTIYSQFASSGAVLNYGAASSFELPNNTSPTVNTAGEIAIDTLVADFAAGQITYFAGETMYVVAMPTGEFSSPPEGVPIVYNATDDEFQFGSSASQDFLFGGTTQPTNTSASFISSGSAFLTVASSASDATNKSGRFGANHYTNAEQPLTGLFCNSTSTGGIVSIGGGTGTGNAATEVRIYAAANNTTTTGTEILTVSTDGLSFDSGTNFLDSYELGDWTPTFDFGTTGDLSVAYSVQTGDYIRIGNRVWLSFRIICTPTFTTSSGNLQIGGIPFTAASSATRPGALTLDYHTSNVTYPSGKTYITGRVVEAATYMVIVGHATASTSANMSSGDVTSGNQIEFRFAGEYPID